MNRTLRAAGFQRIALVTLVLLTALPTVGAQTPPALSPRAVRILLPDKIAAEAVREAVSAASERLTSPACEELLTVFADANGHPLKSKLVSLGVSPAAYMGLMSFHDGRFDSRCRSGRILAFTAPGHRAVFVCPAFTRTQWRNPALAEVIILHETLHSLGLRENPPSSAEITAAVDARCGAKAGRTRQERSAR